MGKNESLESLLADGTPILADGAMGTLLHIRGIPFEACFDELNLSEPDLIVDIHREYIEAGAQIIETNSFGANRYKLSAHGLERRVKEINTAAVQLARRAIEASSKEAYIAGSVGPLGVRLAPFGRVKPEQAYEAYSEQIQALLEAGADLIILETQIDLNEVHEAIRAAKDLSDCPVVATITFTRDDRTLLGDTPARTAKSLVESGADIIGANCSGGPAQLLRILKRMRQAVPQARFSIMPNAGWPERVSGRIMYPATPAYFADYALALCEAGASIVGGCCGTTPEHIAAMHLTLQTTDPPCAAPPQFDPSENGNELRISITEPTEFASRLAEESFVISVEMDPPRGFSTHKLLAGAHLLAEAGADVINVADSPMARMRMSPWGACQLIQQEVGIETVLHFPTRGRNLLRVQGDLLAAHALGVRNLFVVMGDPTAIGDYPEAMDDYDVVPSGLINLIKHRFNSGVDYAGSDIGDATSFFVGGALNLSAQDPDREIRILKKKIDAGVDFVLTQPVYDPQLAHAFIHDYQSRHGELEIPILVGVLPLFSERHAAFLHHEVPGIQIPQPIQREIKMAGKHAPEKGVEIALELLQDLSKIVAGAYLMPAFGRFDLAAGIIETLREKSPQSTSRSPFDQEDA
jgi:methionine synthase I (cobalamin-dependent)/5,10-methylenetetrahydrofolate reductase